MADDLEGCDPLGPSDGPGREMIEGAGPLDGWLRHVPCPVCGRVDPETVALPPTALLMRAHERRTQAAAMAWLERLHGDVVSLADFKGLREWLAASPRHPAAFLEALESFQDR